MKRGFWWIVLAMAALYLSWAVWRNTHRFADPQAKTIIKKMEDRYAALLTYQDSGTVVSEFRKLGKLTDSQTTKFQTVFQRPGKLHFECWTPILGHIDHEVINSP